MPAGIAACQYFNEKTQNNHTLVAGRCCFKRIVFSNVADRALSLRRPLETLDTDT
jgi:hypothetical protein